MPSCLIQAKRLLARLIQCPVVGNAIGALYGDLIPFHGYRINVRDVPITPANKAALYFGMYESAEFRFVKKFLLPDLPVIELGSSIGAISTAIAARLQWGQQLTCVEANPSLLIALRNNIARHAKHLDAHVVHAALAYVAESVPFKLSENNLVSNLAAEHHSETVTVPGITLTALVSKLPRTPFQLVADIEGAEVDLLLHDAQSLNSCLNMIIELHEVQRAGRLYTRNDLLQLITGAGFTVIAGYGAVVVCRRSTAPNHKDQAENPCR